MTRPTIAQIRPIIRAYAQRMGAERYRIRNSDQVDFYGRMPNSIKTHWYFVAWNAHELVKDIEFENECRREGTAI